jgi:hypothetical protein
MLGPAEEDFPMSGFTADFAAGMQAFCDIDVKITQTQWVKCWDSDRIGDSLSRGDFHACSSYVQTAGVRNRYLEFSLPILADVAPAGILTRLENGVPVVDGNSDLSNVTVVDVIGFAPPDDNLALVTNQCTGQKFTNYNIIGPDTVSNFPPDDALKTLLAGNADAMWTSKYRLALTDTLTCFTAVSFRSILFSLTSVDVLSSLFRTQRRTWLSATNVMTTPLTTPMIALFGIKLELKLHGSKRACMVGLRMVQP